MKYPQEDSVIWQFDTAQFRVVCHVEQEDLDPEGQFQYESDVEFAREGGAHWFCAFVSVWYLQPFGERWSMHSQAATYLGHDCLGACSYRSFDEFVSSHRDSDPMNRNCSIMRAKHPAGPNVSICHYFPDMVSEAIRAARATAQSMKQIPLRK